MAVLTIARELGAMVGGEELALCNTLKLHCVTKATLEKRFAEMGIERELLQRFDECRPGLLGAISKSAEYYWETLRTVLLQELMQDNIAFVGRGGNFLLSGLVNCLRIKLIAPEPFRIRQIATQQSISEAEAKKLIRQSDSGREKFCKFYYGKSWSDPANYDLIVNTENISMEELADILPALLPAPPSETQKKQLGLTLQAQIIRHTLLGIPDLQLLCPDVQFDENGTVTLHGNVPSVSVAKRIEETVKNMPQVTAVDNQLTVATGNVPNRLPPMMH
ncbi:MAG: BON domain-containing protein [Lentisphaerae bacterium]|nr:BON domain-containing protein [Lentisphaerota bacterium]